MNYSYIVLLCTVAVAVTSQQCMDNVGSLKHDGVHVVNERTFIFADRKYTVGCERTVVAWQFCYRVFRNASANPVIFYPSIWMPSETNDTIHYTLIQSSPITFIPALNTTDILCPTVTLSTTQQFTAPAGSVVGLYSFRSRMDGELELLRTNKAQSSINTYQFDGNQSSVQAVDGRNVVYNIALRAHFGR